MDRQEGVGSPGLVGAGFRQCFPPQPASVGRARLLVRGLHRELSPLSRLYVELVVSELVTNAVVHAATLLDVRVVVSRTVHVDVCDRSSTPPVRWPATDSHSGNGLRVVETIARRWGFEALVGGKVVWAELDLDSDETHGAAPPVVLDRPAPIRRRALAPA